MPLLNLRNHKKILVIDGSLGFTGGLNIGAENVVAVRGKTGVRDVHFRVAGPVVAHLMSAFAADWQFATGEPLTGACWHPEIASAGSAVARGISEGPDEDMDKLETILLSALAEARSHVRIVTPYFLPDIRLLSALAMAALRGVDVALVLPEHSNRAFVDWAARAHMSDIIKPGCRVFAEAGPFDHAKLLTVDGVWSVIGSANWDERSLRLNFEFNLEIYDGAVTAQLDALIDQKIARAHQITLKDLDGRPLWRKLRDASARLFLPYL
jgi:cardiolipin synthase